ncbi:Hypothetical predicted protein [Paramuricea clavata]|uniref:Uncharacterized protein n=1 Tax=Paramuricea clavata TaxID=317549 RepID=A0A6S7I2B2_PARCT|nr:Hypothetical predicted protein [Paramuricea clavata]
MLVVDFQPLFGESAHGLYVIPLEKSKYFEPEIFDELGNDLISLSSKGNTILLGDFNARTSKLEDYISNKGNKHVYNINEHSLQPLERQNIDGIINNHGKQLINICKNSDMRILNGRTKGDSLGRPIFHRKNGTSVID